MQTMPDFVNTDLSTPLNTFGAGIPVDWISIENGRLPIFWGDNQFLNDETNHYDYPSNMGPKQTLHLPKVCRFIYTYDKEDNPLEWCDTHSGDCTNGSDPIGDPCGNGDQYAEAITVGTDPFPGAVGSFDGWKIYGVQHGHPSGPIYLTDKASGNLGFYFPSGNPGGDPPSSFVNGNPCEASFTVTAFQFSGYDSVGSKIGPFIPFTYYTGTLKTFHPSDADKVKYQLPKIFGVPCCKGAGVPGGNGPPLGGSGPTSGPGSPGAGDPQPGDDSSNCFGGVENGTGDDGGDDDIIFGQDCGIGGEGL